MSTTTSRTLHMIVDGQTVPYSPKDLNGKTIQIGSRVVVPEPNEIDLWNHGNFVATVDDCDQITGDLIVLDADGDFWVVEPDRVEVENESDDV